MAEQTSGLLNRFSIRDTLGVVTLTAVVVAILQHIRVDDSFAYGLLLAPALGYVALRIGGLAFRPLLWCALRPGLSLVVGVLVTLLIACVTDIRTLIAFLPIGSLWMLEIAVVTLIEHQLVRGKWVRGVSTPKISENSPKASSANELAVDGSNEARLARTDGIIVTCASLVCLLLILALSVYGMEHHIFGKGTAFGRYWMLVGSGAVTEFQWQDGYSDIPWRWTHGVGRATPASSERDWKFLGLERYRAGNNEKLRVPYWMPISLLLIWPVTWVLRRDGGRAFLSRLSGAPIGTEARSPNE